MCRVEYLGQHSCMVVWCGMTAPGFCCCGHVKDASAMVVWSKQVLRVKPENFTLLRIKFVQFLGKLSQGTAGPCSLWNSTICSLRCFVNSTRARR